MASLEELIDVPQVQFNQYLGFAGHLTRGLFVLPAGDELIYAAGNQLAFLQIVERPDKEKADQVVPMTRRTGGGFGAPRKRAFGGTTNAPNMSRVMTDTQRKPLLDQAGAVEVPQKLDTAIIVPGSLTRPVLVSGHKLSIAAMALSKSGKILVTGTQAPVGAQPEIIVWDVEQKEPLATLRQHKGSITDIAISPDDSWFATLGDDNLLVIYPLSEEYKHPLYTPLAGRQFQVPKPCTALLAAEPGLLLVGGDQFLTFVEVDLKARTLADVPARVQLQRRFNCFTRIGDFVYAGTEQGDVVKIDLNSRSPVQSCPAGRPFAGAVTALVGNDQDNLICATTAGRFYLVRTDAMVPVASAEVECQTGAGSATATTSALQLGPAQLAAPSPLALAVTCVATGIGSMATSAQCRYAYALGPNCLCRVDKSSLEVRLL